jgi:nucleotide-binding universal stress UspA family protein
VSDAPIFGHVACAVDDSSASRAALGEAVRVWGGGPGQLSVVHVAETPAYVALASGTPFSEQDWVAPAQSWLDDLVRPVPGARAVLLTGDPTAQAVCEWAEREGVDLLVVAAYRTLLRRALLGSFARHAVDHAACPVLVVGPHAIERSAPTPPSGGRRERTPELGGLLRDAPAAAL